MTPKLTFRDTVRLVEDQLEESGANTQEQIAILSGAQEQCPNDRRVMGVLIVAKSRLWRRMHREKTQ